MKEGILVALITEWMATIGIALSGDSDGVGFRNLDGMGIPEPKSLLIRKEGTINDLTSQISRLDKMKPKDQIL